MGDRNPQLRELQQAQDVWFLLEQALDRLPAAHPAELFVRRAIKQSESYWHALRAECPTIDQAETRVMER